MKRLVVLCSLLLSACTEPTSKAVTPPHVMQAIRLCTAHEGFKEILHAERTDEYETCGYRCVRSTGVILYSADVVCMNGGQFHFEVKE